MRRRSQAYIALNFCREITKQWLVWYGRIGKPNLIDSLGKSIRISFSNRMPASSPAFIRAFSSRLLRCLGTATYRGVDDLATNRQIALILQVAIERLE